jgi:hypothetical protein
VRILVAVWLEIQANTAFHMQLRKEQSLVCVRAPLSF